MAQYFVQNLFELSVKAVLLVLTLSKVSDGAISTEDGREMGKSIISEGLNTASVPNYRITTDLGSYGTLITDIRNLAVSSVRLMDSTRLTLEDHNTIDIETSDLSLYVRADWEVDLQSFFFNFDDLGTIGYSLNPVSINLRYTFETNDARLPPTFRQVSCQVTVNFSPPHITANNGESWLYGLIMNSIQEDLKDDIREQMCNMLDPRENFALHRKLSSYSVEFLPRCPDIPNAILRGCSMMPGDFCSIACTYGYILRRSQVPTILCSRNGQWTVDIDSLCQAITCENSNDACIGEGEVCVNENPTGLHCECGEDYERSEDGSRCVGLFSLEFISQLEDITVEEGQSVQMFCQVNDEEATYYWFKGDKQLLDGDIQNGIIVLPSSLIILQIEESDSGTYTCVARSSGGQEVRSSARLTVTSVPTAPSTPAFLERPVDTDLVQGNLVFLPCRVDNPSAVITWYKDNILIEEGVFRNVFLAEDGIVITDAELEHQGTYKCVANVQGSLPAEASAILAFENENIFDTHPTDASVFVGEDHTLRCSSLNPTLTIQWLKDESPLAFNRRILKLRGIVLLRDVVESDEGIYTCVASDIRGNQIASVSAQVTVLPHGLNGMECGTVTSPEVLSSTEEGSLSGRIIGGQDAVRGSAPWMARLYVRGRGHICGGSLIDRQWVVTAAHCFHHGSEPLAKGDLSIRLGDHGILDTEQSETLVLIEEIYEHEDFDPDTFENDIALVKLLSPLRTYSDYIRPICLANRTKDRELMISGVNGRVNGWGWITEGGITPDYMTEVYIPFVPFVSCKRHFRQRELTFTRNMFCAGHPRGGIDACQGDSGGPYSIKDERGRWYLTGLVSWGVGCARAGNYGVYTRYSKYHGWIQKTINMLG